MFGAVELKIRLEIDLRPDGDCWIAHCPPLDLYTQSDSKDSAEESMREAVLLWFESCLERRVLAKALEDVGFKLAKPGDKIPPQASVIGLATARATSAQIKEVEVSVPAYIVDQISASTHAPC